MKRLVFGSIRSLAREEEGPQPQIATLSPSLIMPKLLRILVISFPLLFLVFGASLAYLLVTNVEKPSEYVRRDYYVSLKSNVGTVKVNCFGFPAVMFSAYFLNRIAETGGRILLKKDLLVCDFDYSQLNSTVVRTVVNSTIWFQNPDAGDLTQRVLHLNQTREQILFPMTQAGDYNFDIWILFPSTGWEENYFSNDPTFHVYQSTTAYSAAVRTYQVSILTALFSFLGIIEGVVLFIVESRYSGKKRERNRPSLDLPGLVTFGVIVALAILGSYLERRRKQRKLIQGL